jgi:hypothetical protein
MRTVKSLTRAEELGYGHRDIAAIYEIVPRLTETGEGQA